MPTKQGAAWAIVGAFVIVSALAAACNGLRTAELGASDASTPEGGGGDRDGSTSDDAAVSSGDGGDAPYVPKVPVVLASGQTHAYDIAVDGANVYWTVQNDSDASVRSVPIDGGDVVNVAPLDYGFNPYASELELYGDRVIWTNITSGVGAVFSVPKQGGADSRLFKSGENGEPIAIRGDRVYFTTTFPDYSIVSMAPDGGAQSVHQKGQIDVTGLAVDDDRVYWSKSGPLAGTGGVLAKDLGAAVDAQPTVLYQATTRYEAGGIALGPFDVVWAESESDRVLKVSKGGGPVTPLAEGQAYPTRVVVDGQWVYFTNFGKTAAKDGTIARVPLAGGAVVVLATLQDHPLGLAVDANCIYWTNYGNGEIVRLAK